MGWVMVFSSPIASDSFNKSRRLSMKPSPRCFRKLRISNASTVPSSIFVEAAAGGVTLYLLRQNSMRPVGFVPALHGYTGYDEKG